MENKIDILLTVWLIIVGGLFVLLLMMVGVFVIEGLILELSQDKQTIEIFEECKNDYGQTIVGSQCKRTITCFDTTSLLHKPCEDWRN